MPHFRLILALSVVLVFFFDCVRINYLSNIAVAIIFQRMSTLHEPTASDGADLAELKSNMNVDYVINYNIPSDKAEAEAGFIQLIQVLTKVGLASEVRRGDDSSVLVFVKVASSQYLASQIYRERLQDWLYGVRTSAPEKDITKAFESEPVTEAERLRLVYLLITKPKNEAEPASHPRLDNGRRSLQSFLFMTIPSIAHGLRHGAGNTS